MFHSLLHAEISVGGQMEIKTNEKLIKIYKSKPVYKAK